jgi:hypothetical protein
MLLHNGRCCNELHHKTDFALTTCKLSLHKKIKITQNMTKNSVADLECLSPDHGSEIFNLGSEFFSTLDP